MRKHRCLILLLVFALLLPMAATGATVMETQEQVETPLGEEVRIAAPETPSEKAPQESSSAPEAPRAGLSEAHTHAGWQPINKASELSAGKYYLTNDVPGDFTIAAGENVTLCLSGCSITGSGTNSVITVKKNATLTLCDCDFEGTGGGRITGGASTSSGGGGILVLAGGTLNMEGGVISGNTATNGGGVKVLNGTFHMSGGIISGNTATGNGGGVAMSSGSGQITGGTISGNTATNGGGVCADSKNNLTISAGTISGNEAGEDGGGVCVVNSNSKLTLSGGSITENEAGQVGGGVCVKAGGALTLTGGSVTQNEAAEHGGGVCLAAANSAISMSGAPDISANTGAEGAADNLFLAGVPTIGAMTNTAPIGISMATPGAFTDENSAALISRFTSDNANYSIGVDEDERLFLGAKVTYHKPAGFPAGIAVPETVVYPLGTDVTVDTTHPLDDVKDHYQQKGWSSSPASTLARKVILNISGNVDLYPILLRSFEADSEEMLFFNYRTYHAYPLSGYVTLSDASLGDGDFTFTKNGELPAGLNIVREGGVGKLAGSPTANVGEYEITVGVSDPNANASATLFSLDPVIAYQRGTLTITVVIEPATPADTDFVFAPPANLVANGQPKAASVVAAEGRARMGAITVKYSADDGATYTTTQPTEPGEYLVAIDVTPGASSNYTVASNLHGSDWKFTITEQPAVSYGGLQGKNTVLLDNAASPETVAKLRTAKIIAVKLSGGEMADLAWTGTLNVSGESVSVTFAGKELAEDGTWKVLILQDTTNLSPLYPALKVEDD